MRRGRSPCRNDQAPKRRDKSTTQKIKDLDAHIDTINTDTNSITMDTLIRQTEPPFTERVMRTRVSSRFKLPTQLRVYEGKTDSMDHLDSYNNLMTLQGYSDESQAEKCLLPLHSSPERWGELERLRQAVQLNYAEVEGASDKVVVMAMMEELRSGSLFDSFSKIIPETQSTLQSKADKYMKQKGWPRPRVEGK
ncbi:hypothetical protein Acr_00g0055790 [Actinidia rufa]|uniref:Uncharacterized protein n=1 Tax=Actinidia rufa TaxID=165716 RepID=A0A7J0DM12_9ERIC|nr:hypothetical protein Acr_00g0055790 [Actinidia rufa]